jgi:hypothetical protein
MKHIVRAIILAISLPTILLAQEAQKDSSNRDYDANILIFTSEVRNFIDQSSSIAELQTQMKQSTDSNLAESLKRTIEEKTALLQVTGHRVAEAYFAEVEPETKNDFNEFLSQTLTSRSDLDIYYVFLGNAFAENATRAVANHKSKLKKIYVWSTIGGVVLGFAGGYYFLKFRGATASGSELLKASFIGFGIATVVSTGGYAVRFVLPVDQSISNALDFVARYPYGEDFINDLKDESLDLALQLEGLEDQRGDDKQ